MTLWLGCLALAGCGDESKREPVVAPTPSPAPAATASETAQASIMRPSVAETATPTPPPAPEPVKVTVPFDSNTATLDDAARAVLDEIAGKIAAMTGPVTIRGHTDSRGNDEANKRTSERRAEAVRDYLVDHGVATARVTTIGLGEDRPVAPNATLDGKDDEAGRRRNRRVEVVAEPAAPATPASDQK
jgi:OOP family OmpA-OmpF porin